MTRPAPTEARLESARCVDRLPVKDALSLIFEEDARAHRALGAVLPQLAQAVDVLVECIEAGGRWFNVGAGTSGRLGVLDAAEMPPTFGMPPDRVQGILAGGDRALREAVEGAELSLYGVAEKYKERCARSPCLQTVLVLKDGCV